MSVDVGTAKGYLDLDISKFMAAWQTAQEQATMSSKTLTQKVSKNLDSMGSKITGAGKTLTKTATVPILGIGTAVLKASTSFESAMSKAKAISGTSGKEFEKLRQKAIDLGKSTVFSATEVADGMTEMAKAGWNSQQIMDGMEGVLNAASASGENLASVSTIVADAITGFQLKAKDATKVADLLTQAANAGTIDITDLGESFKYIAPIASSMGLSIEDVTTAISAMSMAGIKGSQAGTSLRTVLARMVKPNDNVAAAMDKLNINITNADGSFKSLNDIVSIMRTAFSGLTDKQKAYYATTLAGQEGMSGLLALLNLSQDEYDGIADSMENANGVAKETSEVMLDNLKGKLTLLKSQLESVCIQLGDILIPIVEKVVDKISDLTTKFSELSPEEQEQIVKIAGIIAVAGPALIIIGKLVSAISAIVNIVGKVPGVFSLVSGAISGLGTKLVNVKEGFLLARAGMTNFANQASPLGASLAGISGSMVAVVAVIGVLVAAFATLWNTNEEFRNKITNIWSQIVGTIQNFTQGIVDRINQLGFDFTSITEVMSAVWNGFCQLLAPVFVGAFQYIQITIETVLGVITGILDVFIGLFTGNWEQAWNGVKEIFVSLWNGIKNKFTNILNVLLNLFNTILGFFGTNWTECWDKIKTFFTDTWDKIKTFFTNMGTKISDTFKAFVDGVVKFFSDLPYNIGYVIGLVIGKVVKFALDMKDKAIEVGKGFVTNTIKFFKELPSKIANWFTKAKDKAVTFAKEFPDKAKDAATNFVKKATNFIKNLPKNIKETFNKAIEKASTFVTDLGKKGLEAGKDLLTKVAEGVTDLPSKMAEIGKNIIDGVWEGIKGAKETFKKNVSKFFSGIVDGIKDGLGIHSPSRVMRDQVGKNIVLGVIAGVNSQKKNAKKNAEQLGALYVKAATNKLVVIKEKNKLTLQEEIDFWKEIKKHTKQGTSAYSQANKKIKLAQDEFIKNAKKTLSDKKKTQDMSLKDEMKYWKNVRKQIKQGTEAYKQATKEIKAIKKDMVAENKKLTKQLVDDIKDVNKKTKNANDKLAEETKKINDKLAEDITNVNTKLAEDIAKVWEEYDKAVQSRKDAILNSTSLFDAFESKTTRTKEGLISNIQSQVDGLKEWGSVLQQLQDRGVKGDLLKALQDMGPTALEDVKLLLNMTNEELATYLNLWNQRNDEALKQATKEVNKQDYLDQITDLNNTAISEINELRTKASEDLNSLQQDYTKTLSELVVTSGTQGTEMGKQLINGFKQGVDKGAMSAMSSVADTMNKVAKTARKTLGIHSPSRVFASIGGYITKGLENGFVGGMKDVNREVDKQMNNLADVDITTKVNGISDVIDKVKNSMLSLISQFDTIDDKMLNAFQNIANSLKDISSLYNQSIGSMMVGDGVMYIDYNYGQQNNTQNSHIKDSQAKQNSGGDTFIFNSPKAIDEIEAARQLRKTKRDLEEGF